MGKEKITFEQFCDYNFRRTQQVESKSGAIWTAFYELNGLINIAELSRSYFHKSRSWFAQKLHGNNVCNKAKSFTDGERHQLAEAFRDIAKRLQAHADEIDNAKME